MRKPERI